MAPIPATFGVIQIFEFQVGKMPKVAGIGAPVHNFISMCGRQLRKPLYQECLTTLQKWPISGTDNRWTHLDHEQEQRRGLDRAAVGVSWPDRSAVGAG